MTLTCSKRGESRATRENYQACSSGVECLEVENEMYPLSSRRLTTHHDENCRDEYVPWLIVSFKDGGKDVTRCAFNYGTRMNSKTKSWNSLMGGYTAKGFGSSYEIGQQTKVWVEKSEQRCVVGVGDPQELIDAETSSDTWGMLGGVLLLPFAGFLFHKGLTTKDDPDDGPTPATHAMLRALKAGEE